MAPAKATKLCESHGSALLSYQYPCVATLALRSGESIMLSIGTTTAKIFRRNSIFGWLFPKRLASHPLVAWDPRYPKFRDLERDVCKGMALDGLLSLISSVESINELCRTWPALGNPVEVGAIMMFDDIRER